MAIQSEGILAKRIAEGLDVYEEVEIEALQTVAMVLSQLLASARMSDGSRPTKRAAAAQRLTGPRLDAGMATGRAAFHQPRARR